MDLPPSLRQTPPCTSSSRVFYLFRTYCDVWHTSHRRQLHHGIPSGGSLAKPFIYHEHTLTPCSPPRAPPGVLLLRICCFTYVITSGNVRVVEIDGPVVRLELEGACGSCPSSTMTMKMGLERRLVQRIPEISEVVQSIPNGPDLNVRASIEEVFSVHTGL